ncbi:MAG: PQQ-binding-like beta-propeller repeat protein [Dehalococcoidia bacterium]|nr:PQQ-binding-like beta-propeller repeat protein [Dehalococcoidia bacterium]
MGRPWPTRSSSASVTEQVVCPGCGELSDHGAKICRSCWHDLSGQQPASEAEVAARRDEEQRTEAVGRRRRILLAAAALAIAVVLLVPGLRAFDARFLSAPAPIPSARSDRSLSADGAWALADGNLGGTRTTTVSRALEGDVAWTVNLRVPLAVPVVAGPQAVYAGLEDGRLVALSVADGRTLWEHRVPGVLDASPALAGDRLLVGLRNGQVLALDAVNGQVIWSADAGRSIDTSPVVVGGIAFVAANGPLLGIDVADGTVLWRHDTGESLVTVTPVVEDDRLVVGSYERVLIFDRVNGQELSWHGIRDSERPVTSVSLADGVIIAITSSELTAIDVEMRRPWYDGIRGAWQLGHIMGIAPEPTWRPDLWSQPAPSGVLGAAVDDGRLIVAGEGELRSFDVTSGDLHWQRRVEGILGPPVLTPLGLLVPQRGELVLYDPATGETLASRDLDGEASEVVVVDGGVVLVGNSGEVSVLR